MSIFEGQQVIYGLPFISFPSYSNDSTFFVTPGHGIDIRRVTALASAIRRAYGFVILIDLTPTEMASLVQEGYMRVSEPHPDTYDIELLEDEYDDTEPVTYLEW